MKKLIFNIGISGSGKSTETLKLKTAKIVSSDAIRLEMFGSLRAGNGEEENRRVWSHINTHLIEYFEDYQTVVLDATNLNLRRRKHYTDKFKHKYPDGIVEARLFFSTPFTSMVNQYWRSDDEYVPIDVVENQFLNLQIPIVGADCDVIVPYGENWFENYHIKSLLQSFMVGDTEENLRDLIDASSISTMLADIYTKHESPYHMESVDEHIKMVIKNTIKHLKTLDDLDDENFLLGAIFHDLGKGFAKNRGGNHGGSFIGHENVSAQFAANLALFNGVEYYKAAEIVRFHMLAHKFGTEIKEKGMRRQKARYNWSDEFVDELKFFAKIDNISRVPEYEKSELHSVIQSITETLNQSLVGTRTFVVPKTTFTFSFENNRIKVTGFNGTWCTMHLNETFDSFEEFENKYLKYYNI